MLYSYRLLRHLDFHVGETKNASGVADAAASAFGTKRRYLKSWAHHLVTVRSITAHHDRFCNRVMSIRPQLLRRDAQYASSKQFPTLLVIKRIYEKSWPGDWDGLASGLSSCFDSHPGSDLSPMGFPENWRDVLGL